MTYMQLIFISSSSKSKLLKLNRLHFEPGSQFVFALFNATAHQSVSIKLLKLNKTF